MRRESGETAAVYESLINKPYYTLPHSVGFRLMGDQNLHLSVILQCTLSPIPDQRKAAELKLDEIQYSPHHLPSLLHIILDSSNSDIALRQVAAIHFKNFISKNWSPSPSVDSQQPQPHLISIADKEFVRNHILLSLHQLPPLLRSYSINTLSLTFLLFFPFSFSFQLLLAGFNLVSASERF